MTLLIESCRLFCTCCHHVFQIMVEEQILLMHRESPEQGEVLYKEFPVHCPQCGSTNLQFTTMLHEFN